MNIIFDGRSVTRENTSGIPEYAKLLFKHLLESKNEDEKYSFFFSSFSKKEIPEEIKEYDYEVINWGIPNKFLQCSSRIFGLPRIGVRKNVDVLFRPHFHPLHVARGVKDILVIHDLSFVRFPHFFSNKKTLWHWLQDPQGQARRADHIITISEATKKDIVDLYGILPDKISVVYSGINNFFREEVSHKELNGFQKENNITGRYILFVGTIEPRKNIEGLVRAFSVLKNKEGFSDVSIIIVGAKGWLYDKILKEVEESSYTSQIHLWGHASFEELRFLYNGASAFVFPSFFEGFGFPPLEAQASGVPVIASSRGGLSETLKESALIINPDDEYEIAGAIEKVLVDEFLRKRLIEKGRQNSARFDWKKTATEVREVIRSVM